MAYIGYNSVAAGIANTSTYFMGELTVGKTIKLDNTGDFTLGHDGAVLKFGTDSDVSLTHVADTGLLLNSTREIQFRDSALKIYSSADGQLDLAADTEIELTSTTVAVEGILNVSGTSWLYNDVYHPHDGVVLHFGADHEVVLTHVHDSGLRLSDSDKMIFGDGNDLQIYHDSNHSLIQDAGTGNLYIDSQSLWLRNYSDSASMAVLTGGGAVQLFNNGSEKFTTTSTGISVTGGIVGSDNMHLRHDGVRLHFGVNDDVYIEHIHDTGLRMPDGDKLFFGTNDDLTIYHDGNNSALTHSGTGDFYIQSDQFYFRSSSTSENMITGTVNAAVTLYHNANAKLATTASGVSVTGNVVTTGEATFGPGGTGTDVIKIKADGGTGTAAGAIFEIRQNSAFIGGLGNKAALFGSGTDTDLHLRAASGIPITFAPNNTDAVTLDTSGRVGIGTTSPSEKLHVVDGGGSDAEMILETSTNSTGARIHLKSPNATGANYHTIGSMNASTANWRLGGTGTAGAIDFQVGSGYTQMMRVNSTGLGIGTTSPGVELHISSAQPEVRLQDSDGTNQYGQMYQAGGVTYFLTRNNTSNGQFYFNLYDGTTLSTKMVIDSSGRVGIGTTSPGHELALVGDYQPLRVDSTTSSTAMIRLDHNGTIKSYWGASGGYQLILSNASAANQYYFRDLNGYSRFQIIASTTGGGSPGGAKLDALGSAASSPPVIASIDMTLTDDTDGSEDGAIAFYTAANGTNAEHIRLNTSGNVGVGTTSPSAKLDVVGEVQGTGGFYRTDGYSGGQYSANTATDHGQYQAAFTDRHGAAAKAAFEWGHSNGSGYGCTLAFTNGGGAPYVGWNCGPGTQSNTWRTYGIRGLAQLVSHGVMYFYDVADTTQDNQGPSGTANKEGTDSVIRITLNATNGNATFGGALSKGSGSFLIEHPLDSKKDTHNLAHSFIEGPQADLIYRGKVVLSSGAATVNIDTSAGMTSGTFEALCTDVQCFTSNETGWTAVKGSVSGATLTIQAQDNSCTDTISWMVVGERKDKHMIDTDWTDDNGKVIVEPLKPEPVEL